MCIPLIGRVIAREADVATVALLSGATVRVNPALCPHVQPGAHVLLDRGLIVEIITVEQVEEMIRLLSEIEELWAEEDAGHAADD